MKIAKALGALLVEFLALWGFGRFFVWTPLDCRVDGARARGGVTDRRG